MDQVLYRVATFSNWPAESTVSPVLLAKSGFVYSGKRDEVTCFACNISLSGWSADDDPLERHKRSAPDCPFLKGGAGVQNGNFGTNPESIGGNLVRHSEWTQDPQYNQMAEIYQAASARAMNHGVFGEERFASARGMKHGVFGEERFSHMNRSSPDFVKLRHEEVRLDTFYDWPASAQANPEALAHAGFFYTGEEDRVRCAFCRRFVHNWKSSDSPADEHIRHYPECRFVRGLDVGNVPIGTDPFASRNTQRNANGEQSRNTVFYPATNWQDIVRHPEESRPTPGQTQEFQFSPPTEPPRYPRYTELRDRIESFSIGYVSPGQTAQGLAQAGWFYIGPGDKVLCFQCGGNLKDWELDDDPWVEHEKWYPTCAYLLTYGPTARLQISNPASTPFNRYNYVEPTEIEARMDTPIIRAILDMGFTRDLVKSAIERRLLMTGNDFPNAESLLEELFRMGEDQLTEPTPTGSGYVQQSVNSSSNENNSGLYNWAAVSSALPISQGLVQSQPSEIRSLPPERPSAATAPYQSMITAPSNEQAAPAAGTAYGQNNDEQMEVEPTNEEALRYLQENRRMREAKICKICLDAEIDTVFLVCGHLVCCHDCSQHLKICPICRQSIRGTVKTCLS